MFSMHSRQDLYLKLAKMSKSGIGDPRRHPFAIRHFACCRKHTEHWHAVHNSTIHCRREGELGVALSTKDDCGWHAHKFLLHGDQAADLLHASCRSKSQERKLRSFDSMNDSLDSTDLDASISASLLDAELNGGPAATRSAVELSLDEDKVCFWLVRLCQRPFQ